MKTITTYLPYALCLILFFAGRMTAPDNSKDISKKYEQERKILFEAIGQKDALIVRLNEKSEGIRRQMSIDSAKYLNELRSKQKVIIHYKNLYEKISFRNHTTEQLDSLLSVIYPD